jgi:hypothetical protein
MAAPPEPATPGLLDLLTVGMIPETRTAETDDLPTVTNTLRDSGRDGRNHRAWVEVEA